jgi:hypothetical protein
MQYVENKSAEPAPECFLLTADTLVQSVMLRHGALRREKPKSERPKPNESETVRVAAAVA